MYTVKIVFILFCLVGAALSAVQADVTLVRDGKAQVVVIVPESVMKPSLDAGALQKLTPTQKRAEADRVRLRESAKDLAHYLGKMSGATVTISTKPDAPAGLVPILIGEPALKRFGPPAKGDSYRQGWRIVASPKAIGLFGQSDLSSSYAIYELLDRLGCRWFMPSELGEVIPEMRTIALPETDVSGVPFTLYRGIWYADEAYKRRNRCGGLLLHAGHALEGYITKKQREQHPEWCALVGGKRDPNRRRLEWHRKDMADAIADTILAHLDKAKEESVSISPDDGLGFSESPEDRALDAGDRDETIDSVSMTDRFLVLCNRIAARVTKKHPDVLFGMLAYATYTRPPVREPVHPNIVPQIAPITYSRAHPMTDDRVPGNEGLRFLIEGWGKKAKMVSYYAYCFNLAEVSAPNPMITKWSVDVPIILANNCKFWQPETLPNFETSMHALYLGLRLAWDPTQKPADIIKEINTKFYGAAAGPMTRYWTVIDDAWVKTPEYAGCGFSYGRRFTPEVMKNARAAMDEALDACKTVTEYRRVKLADDSLRLFELFMKLRWDFSDGRWNSLDRNSTRWLGTVMDLGAEYKNQYTFCNTSWSFGDTVCGRYFRAFFYAPYQDAARIARTCVLLTRKPMRQWKYLADEKNEGEKAGWFNPALNDKAWKTTDPCVETWSTLGYHNYLGTMWYRASVKPFGAVPKGKKVSLWIGSTDGTAKVYVNGTHVPYTNAKGQSVEEFSGYCQPASFDVTAALKPGAMNQITIKCKRPFINELGSGGLMGPVVLYREK